MSGKSRYKRTSTVYKLVFADPEMDGLEVRVRSTSIGKMLDLTLLAGLKDKPNLTPEDVAKVETVFELFAQSLVSWNLDDESDEPVPTTLEGVRSQDADFINVIIMAWMTRVMGVSAPLANGSTGGPQFPEALIPMETLSPSLPS